MHYYFRRVFENEPTVVITRLSNIDMDMWDNEEDKSLLIYLNTGYDMDKDSFGPFYRDVLKLNEVSSWIVKNKWEI